MNYWHLQMQPDDKLTIETIKQVLIQKRVIGLGSWWENKHGQEVPDPTYFRRDMKIGDIVMIRDGSKPVALVRVLSDAFEEKNIAYSFDWFDLRRKVEIIDFFDFESERILQDSLRRYGKNHIQAPGTLTFCSGYNATNDFIINWYKLLERKNIMDNVNLSQDQKKEFTTLYNKYFSTYTDIIKSDLERNAQNLFKDFDIYLQKIRNNNFLLDDYTNRQANETGLPGYYFCNFLERTTRDLFGSSKPAGSALSFGIKADLHPNSFTINGIDAKNHEKNNRTEAELEFTKYKEFFKSLVSESDIQVQMKLIESNQFITAKQILRKFLVLLHPFAFIYAYNEKLDVLYRYFFKEDFNLTKIEKSYQINIIVKDILSINEDNYNQQIILSRFLWKLANSQSLLSQANPNVILYGPPGTGKTYKVKQDLEFLTKGDSSRVKYVVFHPSYGYEDFIEGIKPCGITENGNMKFQLINGAFKEFCKTAKSRPSDDFYFVVDEINRANLSSVFGETLVCIENSYRDDVKEDFTNRHLVSTQYSAYQKQLSEEEKENLAYEISPDGEVLFGVPKNVYFVGMMNNVDKNIDSFDLALRRRFKWIYFGCDYEVIESIKNYKGIAYDNIVSYANACRSFNEFISSDSGLGLGKSFEFGHALYMKISRIERTKTIKQKSLDQLFSEFLLPTLHEYLRAYYDEAEIEHKAKEAQSKFKI